MLANFLAFWFVVMYKDNMTNKRNDLPASPRRIDPGRSFLALTDWIMKEAQRERAPGLIVGISGTDSILTFLAAAKAFKRLGKGDRVLGVNFGPQPDEGAKAEAAPGACLTKEFNWVAAEIFPWLRSKMPQAQLELDSSPGYHDDNIRWGKLFSRAVRDTDAADSLSGNHYFTVGTRNATEDALGTHSQLSTAVSMMPLVGFYKSEVLQMCEYLGVPDIALQKSRETDCACGRFDTAAHHIEEIDAYIMAARGELSKDYIKAMDPDVRNAVLEYVLEEEARNEFRRRTPYRPTLELAVTK